ncbi:MAG TPA: acyl-CoA dehydrogenase family protein [Candidatus Gastranaerophilales bacterium]|nr:acyl-CoA dehydrogenase family protein [Candidatus Gastranaerophilales bacterium]
MNAQFDLGSKHLNCIKKTQESILEVEKEFSYEKNPKEIIKKYLSMTFGQIPAESKIYDDYLGMTLSIEELSKHDSLSAYVLLDQIVFREILKTYTNSKSENILSAIETIGLLCMEPGYSGINSLQTKAVKTNEGWQIHGIKMISNEQIYSDKFLVFAKDEENKIRLFVIPEENIKVEETEKMISSSKIIVNQINLSCTVSEKQNIAVINDNFEKIHTVARMLVAAASLGIAHSSLVKGIEVAKGTKNSKGETLSSSQSIQFTLADMFSEVEAARMLTYYCADAIDKGKYNVKIASMAKVKASEAANNVTNETLHLIGNIGYISNSDFGSLIQRSIDSRVKGGTNRAQRTQIYEYMLAKK